MQSTLRPAEGWGRRGGGYSVWKGVQKHGKNGPFGINLEPEPVKL